MELKKDKPVCNKYFI